MKTQNVFRIVSMKSALKLTSLGMAHSRGSNAALLRQANLILKENGKREEASIANAYQAFGRLVTELKR